MEVVTTKAAVALLYPLGVRNADWVHPNRAYVPRVHITTDTPKVLFLTEVAPEQHHLKCLPCHFLKERIRETFYF